MSIWLYTLRDHKIKPTVEEIPIYHYKFCKSHACSSWQADIDAKKRFVDKAKRIFYPTIQKYYFCESRWKDIWYEEFSLDVKPEFEKGILVSLHKRKGTIYFQNRPHHTWYDCDPIYGIEVGEFVKGQVWLSEQGKEIVSNMKKDKRIQFTGENQWIFR